MTLLNKKGIISNRQPLQASSGRMTKENNMENKKLPGKPEKMKELVRERAGKLLPKVVAVLKKKKNK